MCIRDRSYPAGIADGVRAASVCGWRHSNHSLRKAIETVVICLLYTSDAADERSSVDLGGRRIIKKKITVTKERMHSLSIRR